MTQIQTPMGNDSLSALYIPLIKRNTPFHYKRNQFTRVQIPPGIRNVGFVYTERQSHIQRLFKGLLFAAKIKI